MPQSPPGPKPGGLPRASVSWEDDSDSHYSLWQVKDRPLTEATRDATQQAQRRSERDAAQTAAGREELETIRREWQSLYEETKQQVQADPLQPVSESPATYREAQAPAPVAQAPPATARHDASGLKQEYTRSALQAQPRHGARRRSKWACCSGRACPTTIRLQLSPCACAHFDVALCANVCRRTSTDRDGQGGGGERSAGRRGAGVAQQTRCRVSAR